MNDVNISNPLFKEKLAKLNLETNASSKGFIHRKRKIQPYNLLLSFLSLTFEGSFSFRNWAIRLSYLGQLSISKQGIWKRMNQQHIDYLRLVLQQALSSEIRFFSQRSCINTSILFSSFKRVLVQDSTTIGLPLSMREWYKGNWSRGEVKSAAKIQATIDLKAHQFNSIKIGQYTDSDAKEAQTSLDVIKKGDLIIRDLGYYSLDLFDKIASSGAYYLSRLKFGTKITDLNGKELSIKKLMKKRKVYDQVVLVGKKQIESRLIIVRLDQSIVEQRKRNAQKHRHKDTNHSKEYYELLEYAIYITNIDQNEYSWHHITQMYALRWRIETIFKTWKSHLNLKSCIDCRMTNPQTATIMITYLMIYVVIFQLQFYNYYWGKIYDEYGKHLSLEKFNQFFALNFYMLCRLKSKEEQVITEILARSCCIETRKDKLNYIQKALKFNS